MKFAVLLSSNSYRPNSDELQRQVEELLGSIGFRLLSKSHNDFREGICVLEDPDVIVSIAVERETLRDCAAQLASLGSELHAPTILVIANPVTDCELESVFGVGVDEFLASPLRPAEFASRVERLVERHEREQVREAMCATLQQRDILYRQMFEKNQAIKLIIDPATGEIVDANPAAAAFYGYSLDQLRQMNIADINLINTEGLKAKLKAAVALQRKPFNFEHRLASGEIRTVEVNSSPLNESGRVLLFSIINDVTERRRAEEELRESEERYRELFENAGDIIFTHDPRGNFLSINSIGERLTGYSREELCQTSIDRLVMPRHRKLALRLLDGADDDQYRPVYEMDIVTRSGSQISIEVSCRPIRRNGKVVAIQGAGRDVTERNLVNARLKESEAELRALFAAMTDPIFVLDRSGRYLKVAPTAPSLLIDSREKILGRKLHEVFPAWQADVFLSHIRRALDQNRTVETEYSLIIYGAEVWFAATISPKDDDSVIWIARDISERKQNERAIEEQFERAALLNRLTSAVRGSLDIASVFQTAVSELGRHLNVDRCVLLTGNSDQSRIVAEYSAPGLLPDTGGTLALFENLILENDSNDLVAIHDVTTSPRLEDEVSERHSLVKSLMRVPISTGGDVKAVFMLATVGHTRKWTDVEIELARAFSDQTGIAIRQAELYQKAEATYRREAVINKLSLAVRASLSMPEILTAAARELVKALGASRASIYLFGHSQTGPYAEYSYATPGTLPIKSVNIDIESAVWQHLCGSQQSIAIHDSLNYDDGTREFSEEIRAHASRLGTRAQILSPLVVNGSFRGALSIHQTDHARRWTDDELSLVHVAASQVVTGIAQAELFEFTRQAKKEWETTFNAMSDGIFIFDRSGKLSRVNRTGAMIEDSWPHLLTGQSCCEILRVAGEPECLVDLAISEGRSITVELTPENYNRPLLVTIEPIPGTDNQTIGAVCTARDLSELRKIEAVAQERQTLLTNILESVREPIWAMDTNGCLLWSNGATTRTLGFKSEELIGHHFSELLHPSDREIARERFNAALSGEAQSYEARFQTRTSEVRFALFDNAPLVTNKQTTGVLCVARDITEQKQQRQRVAQADKLRALGQLASGVAHDFNNALAAILGRAQLLGRNALDDDQIRDLKIIQTAAEDAANTVRRIQTFARQTNAEEFQVFEINQLLKDAIEITRTRWENEANSRGISIEVVLDAPEPGLIDGNASELREVFVNLIVNAVDAMPRGGRIDISSRCESSSVSLLFADCGIGMVEEVRERIFEPFYTTKGLQGTGLGLAVSYGIIERHGGSIHVETEAGRGTTFEVILPALDSLIELTSPEPDQNVAAPLSILVVDDEEFVRETLCEMLQALGHDVATADSGRTALGKLKGASKFDIVFSDLSMPEMDGWEFARELRRYSPGMTIVLVTGYGKSTQPPFGDGTLVNAVIGKPFDFSQICDAISKVRPGDLPGIH